MTASDNVALLWQKVTDSGTFSGGSWAGSLPLASLQSTDTKRVARTANAATTSTRWRVDLGVDRPRPVNSFTLIEHSGTVNATWRIVVTNDATDTDVGARVLDTGILPLWSPNVALGSQPWGAFPWSRIDSAAYPSGTLAFHISPTIAFARYIWVYVADTANPAGYFQAGRFFAGVAWSPTINIDYGGTIRWADNSEVRRTLGGRRLVTSRPRFREFDLSFSWLSKDEALGTVFDISRTLGKNGDFLLILKPDDSAQHRFRRAIYAGLKDSASIEEASFENWRWSISAEELI